MKSLHDLTSLRYRNVLIIDDEPAIHQMFSTCLQPDSDQEETSLSTAGEQMVDIKKRIYNFIVHSALSGEEALELCKTQRKYNAPIQMAFVDMRMKGWNGVETIKQLLDFDHRMNFVIMTGFPDDTRDKVEEHLGAAPLQIFAKPTNLEQIYDAAYSLTSRWNRLHGDN
ncbi:response regulator [Pelagicoccus sp. SDUM812002]|uniref:response regulator transcription factor n=1 Tax=Pelagicoccus sp. SDUM812002 TaxID=3041266 RepID=UPI00280DA1C2|nr:response regulator [Pelagicoccus sp. SDUM812002]MDQ8185198.1 response regulator [Pelagicoccus sp. SDUM812002]